MLFVLDRQDRITGKVIGIGRNHAPDDHVPAFVGRRKIGNFARLQLIERDRRLAASGKTRQGQAEPQRKSA